MQKYMLSGTFFLQVLPLLFTFKTCSLEDLWNSFLTTLKWLALKYK